MLCNLSKRTESFLTAVQSSCFAKQKADLSYHLLWICQLLSCLCGNLRADLLVSARTVESYPRFKCFYSANVRDSGLGSVQSWPAGPALRVLYSWSKRRLTVAQYGFYVKINIRSQQLRTCHLFVVVSLGWWLFSPLGAWFFLPYYAGRIRVGILNQPDWQINILSIVADEIMCSWSCCSSAALRCVL